MSHYPDNPSSTLGSGPLPGDRIDRSQEGSHLKLRKGDRTVIVPHPKKDLPLGTARGIYQQAGLL